MVCAGVFFWTGLLYRDYKCTFLSTGAHWTHEHGPMTIRWQLAIEDTFPHWKTVDWQYSQVWKIFSRNRSIVFAIAHRPLLTSAIIGHPKVPVNKWLTERVYPPFPRAQLLSKVCMEMILQISTQNTFSLPRISSNFLESSFF